MLEKERLARSAFGALLRRHRLAAGLSQEALAEQARMSANGIGALERGDRRYPYRETVVLLAKALGLSPAAAAEFAAAAARPRRPHDRVESGREERRDATNLPFQRTSLIGRESEIVDIVGILQESRLVTVTGAGGVGKTRTALAVGDALLEATKAGVWFVELAPLAQGAFVPAAVAQALKVQDSPDRPLVESLLAYLKQKSLLLILDNCEHVIAEAATLADALLRGCPNLRILATSRERLRIAGEQTYRLPSLRFPSPAELVGLSADAAAEYGAVVLFAQRAQAIDRRFVLRDDNAAIVAEICRQLDGIPLAIELAAARVNILPVRVLSQKLDQRLRLLTGGDRTALGRHQTMRALIDWSHDLLDERERTLFRHLGIFVNGFTLEGAVVVGGSAGLDELEVFEVLGHLVDKSLVLAEADGDMLRYRLLESTRAYAVERLVAAAEYELLAGRHLSYLRDRFAAIRSQAEQTARLAELEDALMTEFEDVRAALDGALSRGDVVTGAKLLADVGIAWHFVRSDRAGMQHLEIYVAALPEGESTLLAWLLSALSRLIDAVGLNKRALEVAEQAVAHARRGGGGAALAFALSTCTFPKLRLGRVDEVRAELAEAEAIPNSTPFIRLRLLNRRALFYRWNGDLDEAIHSHEELHRQYRSIGDVRRVVNNACTLAELEYSRGNTQRAIALAREALATRNRLSIRYGLARQLVNLAGYLCALDEPSSAQEAAREAISLSADSEPDAVLGAVAIEHLALAYALRGDLVPAAVLAGYAYRALQRLGLEREFTEQVTRDRLSGILADRLARNELERLTADGAALTPEAAIALALGEAFH